MPNSFEQKLTRLFDRQDFAQNPTLTAIIDEVEARYFAELSDEDLSLISAAGEQTARLSPDDTDEN